MGNTGSSIPMEPVYGTPLAKSPVSDMAAGPLESMAQAIWVCGAALRPPLGPYGASRSSC
jgi:hypothetical protein